MNYLRERVAYIKGLAEGMKLDDSTDQGKLLMAIIDVLDDIALAVDDMEEVQEELMDQVDNIDDDLAEIEKIVYGDFELNESENDDTFLGEFECPHCNEQIYLYSDMIDKDSKTIQCPKCEKDIEVEFECDCEDDDCNCGNNGNSNE